MDDAFGGDLRLSAIHFQEVAADAHQESADCFICRRFGFAEGFQLDAAYFARRARECLFELIGAEPEDE